MPLLSYICTGENKWKMKKIDYKYVAASVAFAIFAGLSVGFMIWLPFYTDKEQKQEKIDTYNSDVCLDKSSIISTNAGTPNDFSCNNKHHVMLIQPITLSGYNVTSVVTCKCSK